MTPFGRIGGARQDRIRQWRCRAMWQPFISPRRSCRRAPVEICHVHVPHPETAGRFRLTDRVRIVRIGPRGAAHSSARKMALQIKQIPSSSKSPENLQKNDDALKLAFKRTAPRFRR
jgi:hypothetical protein